MRNVPGAAKGFGALVAAALMAVSMAASAQNAKIKVRDGWTPGGLQAAWFYAMGKNMFAARGIDLEFDDGTGSPVAAQLVAAGQYDMAHADLSVMAVARTKGMKLISVAGLLRNTTLAVFVPKDSGIKTIKDLVGKQVLYTATSMEAPYLAALAKAGGVSKEQIDFLNVDAQAKISTYTAGRGDGMITTVPFGAPIVNPRRPSNTIEFSNYGLILPGTGIFIRESDLADAKKAKALETVVAVYLQAWTEIIGGREAEAADLIMKQRPEAKLNRDSLIDQIKIHYPYLHTQNTKGKPLGWQAPDDWARTIVSMEAAGLMPAGAKPGDFFTNRMIQN